MDAKTKVAQAFLELKTTKLYFSQLTQITKLSNSSLQNTLEKLEQQHSISISKTTAHTFYNIKNTKLFSLEFAKSALDKFNNLNRDVRIPLGNFLKETNKNNHTIVLFGSASRNEETEKSDIDLLIVSDNKKDYKQIKKSIDAISHYPLSLFTCTYNEFVANKDHIIVQAKQTGFPVQGEQTFYEVLLNEFD